MRVGLTEITRLGTLIVSLYILVVKYWGQLLGRSNSFAWYFALRFRF